MAFLVVLADLFSVDGVPTGVAFKLINTAVPKEHVVCKVWDLRGRLGIVFRVCNF